MNTISLVPRKIVRWVNGERKEVLDVTPTPFNQDRAEKIYADRSTTAGQFDHLFTDGEFAYVMSVWDAIPNGSSTFNSAFQRIRMNNMQGMVTTTKLDRVKEIIPYVVPKFAATIQEIDIGKLGDSGVMILYNGVPVVHIRSFDETEDADYVSFRLHPKGTQGADHQHNAFTLPVYFTTPTARKS